MSNEVPEDTTDSDDFIVGTAIVPRRQEHREIVSLNSLGLLDGFR